MIPVLDSSSKVLTGSGVAVKCFDFEEYEWENDVK